MIIMSNTARHNKGEKMGTLPSVPMRYTGVVGEGEAGGDECVLSAGLIAASMCGNAMDSAHGVFCLASKFALR
jgi:hypothetical protein